jgi:hypothetical protein
VSELTEAAENIRNAYRALRAYMRFEDAVGAIAIDLVVQGDEVNAFRLLEALKDLQAQTGELFVEDGS